MTERSIKNHQTISVDQIPFLDFEMITDFVSRFLVLTDLNSYPDLLQKLETFRETEKAETFYYKNKFCFQILEEDSHPTGWKKFLKEHKERKGQNIDLKFKYDYTLTSFSTGKKYINFKVLSIKFSE